MPARRRRTPSSSTASDATEQEKKKNQEQQQEENETEEQLKEEKDATEAEAAPARRRSKRQKVMGEEEQEEKPADAAGETVEAAAAVVEEAAPAPVLALAVGEDEESEEEDEPITLGEAGGKEGEAAETERDSSGAGKRPISATVSVATPVVPEVTAMTAAAAAAAEDAAVSEAFADADSRVRSHPWDLPAWKTLLTEAMQGRSGAFTLADVFRRQLVQFPRAGRLWSEYVKHCLGQGDDAAALAGLESSLLLCGHVELWRAYVKRVKKNTIDTVTHEDERFLSERDELQGAFERAIEHVGFFYIASPLWADYIEFLESLPEGSHHDKGTKIMALRSVFQRAVSTPLSQVEEFWTRWEAFEMRAGEQLAKKLLDEYQAKHKAAKAVAMDRAALFTLIQADRLALPADNSPEELAQLKAWKRLIEYELGNPEYVNPAGLTARIRQLMILCLACFTYHPEVWIEFAHFEKSQGRLDSARQILKEGLTVLKDSTLLAIALAELEQEAGNVNQARVVLRDFTRAHPSSAAFAALQQFAHRHDGIQAARRVYALSEPYRRNGTVSYHFGLSAALLELDTNREILPCCRICEGLLDADGDLLAVKDFVLIYATVLHRAGDTHSLRSLLERSLAVVRPSYVRELWDLYANLALTGIGLSGDALSSLLKRRLRQMEALEGTLDSAADNEATSTLPDMQELARVGLLTETELQQSAMMRTAVQLCERLFITLRTPFESEPDRRLQERVLAERRGGGLQMHQLQQQQQQQQHRGGGRFQTSGGRSYGGGGRHGGSSSSSGSGSSSAADLAAATAAATAAAAALAAGAATGSAAPQNGGTVDAGPFAATLTPAVQKLLDKLPAYAGAKPDVEVVVRQLIHTPLPPPPERSRRPVDGGSSGGGAGHEQDRQPGQDVFRQRQRVKLTQFG